MNVISIELCAEDRVRLDKIIEGLGALRRPDCSSCVEGVASYMAKAADVMDAHPVSEPFPTPAAPVAAAPTVAPTKPSVTLEQIQKKATEVAAASAEKRAAVRAAVNVYSVRVSDLPEHAWDAVWAKLCALESEA